MDSWSIMGNRTPLDDIKEYRKQLESYQGYVDEWKTVKIADHEVQGTRMPPSFYVITKLIKEGAPIKLLRKNRIDVSELREDEYEITGFIKRWSDFKGNVFYTFKKEAKENFNGKDSSLCKGD